MIINKTNLIVFLVGVFLGLCTGFFSGKAIYDKPLEESVKRDTITIHDTVPDIAPTPKDSVRTRWITRWLPAKHDTITQWMTLTKHDSVAVQVPITSKHYGNETYDAWVSGFEPNLDSIRVYQKTQYITTTITKMKPPDKWDLNVVGGIDYNTASQKYTPYAGGELIYKPNRLQIGVQGGVVKNNDKVEPHVGVLAKYTIF